MVLHRVFRNLTHVLPRAGAHHPGSLGTNSPNLDTCPVGKQVVTHGGKADVSMGSPHPS